MKENNHTVMILSIWIDGPGQTVQTQIRLLPTAPEGVLKEQSDHG